MGTTNAIALVTLLIVHSASVINMLTFPMASSPLSKNRTTPRERKPRPNATSPNPISAGQRERERERERGGGGGKRKIA